MTEEQTAKLLEWETAKAEVLLAKPIIEKEQALRKEVQAMFFPIPVEGTNNFELSGGYKLRLTYKIDRKVDEGALEAVKEQLQSMGVNPDTLIEMKPILVLKAYRGLVQINADAAKIFEQALTIKPGSPTLELVAPKEQ